MTICAFTTLCTNPEAIPPGSLRLRDAPAILPLMDRLWTPWRHSYVSHAEPDARKGVPAALSAWPLEEDRHCVFCNLVASADYAVAHGMPLLEADRAAFIVHRGERCFVCLNAFPYATGHLLILPYEHLDSLTKLSGPAAEEMIHLAQKAEAVLRAIYRPDGLNFGLNVGEAAGAGVASHLHMHGLPRWRGDVNFMTVTAETRVLPETLDVSWERISTEFAEQATSPHL
jgi:ATP adenylyltransferase